MDTGKKLGGNGLEPTRLHYPSSSLTLTFSLPHTVMNYCPNTTTARTLYLKSLGAYKNQLKGWQNQPDLVTLFGASLLRELDSVDLPQDHLL